MQKQMLFILGETQAARVGEYDARIVHAACQIIEYHAVEHAGLGILVVYIKIYIGDLVIERLFGDLHLGSLLPHREHQGPHLCLSHGQHIILEEKRADCDQYHQYDQRLHDLEQRDARCLQRRKLEFLAEIAERHQRRQQHGKRQRHRHHSQRSVEKQLADHTHRQTLAYNITDKAPQKLHHHNEEADKKSHGEQRQKALKHERI